MEFKNRFIFHPYPYFMETPDTPIKTNWWTETKKLLLSQLVTILITPASIYLAFYLTEHAKVAKAEIHESSIEYNGTVDVNRPNDSVLANIRDCRTLYNDLQLSLKNDPEAIDWLVNNGSWTSNCKTVFKNAASYTITSIEASKTMTSSFNHLPAENRMEIEKALFAAKEFVKTINTLDSIDKTMPMQLTGQVTLTFDFINPTSFDGVLDKNVVLKYDKTEVPLKLDKGYLQLKQHSFLKVVINTYQLEDDSNLVQHFDGFQKPYSPRNKDEKKRLIAFVNRIKNKQEIKGELIFTLDDRKLRGQPITIKYEN